MSVFRMLRFAMFATLWLLAHSASAICPLQPQYRYVGDTANDPMCTHDDIQSAIDSVVCPNTTIVITSERSYTNQALSINNKSLTIAGAGNGVPCGNNLSFCDPSVGPCSNPPPTQPVVTLSGGQPNKSVLTITGHSNVLLKYIEITGGNIGASQRGGGIFFGDAGSGGYGVLTLDTVTVDHNTAGYGGGISFSPSSDGTSSTLSALTLLSNTLILENTAVNDGGGIRIEGVESSLFALQPQTLIAYNKALNGYGGGVVVVGARVADFGSPGYNGGAVLQFNSAYGGGGAIAEFNHGLARVFTTDPQHPVQVSSNSTSGLGGAIYIQGSRACVYNYQINNNIGANGAAIYAEEGPDTSGLVDLNPTDACGPNSPTDEGAMTCAVPCNQMYGNIAEDSANQPTGGSVVGVSNSIFAANKLDLRGSVAGDLVEAASAYLTNCLLAANHTEHELIGSAHLAIDSCTIANNTIDNGYVIYVPSDSGNGELDLVNSIIDQPANLSLEYDADISRLKASYLLLLDTSSFPVASDTIVPAEPTFVDAANGDYHLTATSWGIDFAPAAGAAGSTDLDGSPRSIDLPGVPNLFGPRDLGAYERQYVCAADTIFCDDFDGYL